MRMSRREFVKSATAGGIVLSLSRLATAEEPGFAARETLPGRQRWNPAATGVGRIDGVAKVTGSKLYAADFRAADLPGWPAKTSHAMLIRAADATHVYGGLDLSRLTGALRPSVVVTADDLARIGARVPEFYAGDLLCPVGKTPLYLGQPIALLIFEEFDAFDQARLALRDGASVKFGEKTGPVVKPPYAAFRFTRVAGPTPDSPDVYSPVQNGWVSPPNLTDAEQPNWTPLAGPAGHAYAEAAGHGEAIRAELAANDPAHPERSAKGVDGKTTFSEGVDIGYRWFDKQKIDPLFAFGYGLSYSSFEYSDLRVKKASDDGLDVSVRVKNTGAMAGDEVVQAYLDAPAQQPQGVQFAVRTLGAFDRVTLGAGESKDVTMHVAPRSLEYWSVGENRWVRADGRVVRVGASSRDLRLNSQ